MYGRIMTCALQKVSSTSRLPYYQIWQEFFWYTVYTFVIQMLQETETPPLPLVGWKGKAEDEKRGKGWRKRWTGGNGICFIGSGAWMHQIHGFHIICGRNKSLYSLAVWLSSNALVSTDVVSLHQDG